MPVNNSSLLVLLSKHFSYLLFFLCLVLLTFCSLPNRISKKIEKQDFATADSLLRKSWTKHGPGPATYYLRSRLLLDTVYHQQIDSAHVYIDAALAAWPPIDKKQQRIVKKLELDSSQLVRQSARIDSAAFARALAVNTVTAYQGFLNWYADAPQAAEATRLRNALAFSRAEQTHTWQAYQYFFQTYPAAEETPEARERYEELLFKERTQTGTLHAYRAFLAEHPQTPYRERLLRNIYLLSTASNQIADYRRFLSEYPSAGQWTRQAASQLYYLDTTFLKSLPETTWADSLQQASSLSRESWIPVLESEGWYLLNSHGKVTLGPFADVHPDYRCEGILEDVVEVINEQPTLLSRDGHTLLASGYDEIKELGNGMLQLRVHGHEGLLHKSGRMLAQPIYDAVRRLTEQVYWLTQKGKQGLLAANGQWLVPLRDDSIRMEASLILIGQDSAWQLSTLPALIKHAQQNTAIDSSATYQYIRPLNDSVLLARRAAGYTLLNQNAKELLAPRPFSLQLVCAGVVMEQDSAGFRLHALNTSILPTRLFKNYQLRQPWLALRDATHWTLLNLQTAQFGQPQYDSLQLLQDSVWYTRQGTDERLWFLRPDTTLQLHLSPNVRLLLLPTTARRANKRFDLVVEENGQRAVYSPQGNLRFRGRYTDIQQPDSGLYVLKDRSGVLIVDATGTAYDATRYDAAANYQKGTLITLKRGKFGLLQPYRGFILPAKYDAAPRPLTDSTFLVYQKKRWGLINSRMEWLLKPDYDEILLWNDSSAWVKAENRWSLQPFNGAAPGIEGVISLRSWTSTAGQQYALITTPTGLGLFHSQIGMLAPPVYDDLLVMGRDDKPVFYAEVEDEEADAHIVQYLNAQGEVIYKKSYSEEAWLQLYCD